MVQRADATTLSFGGYSTIYGFDCTSKLTSEVRTGSSNYTKSYTYDGMGNRTQKVENGTPTNYTYNGNGRITSDGTNAYSYDNNGNLTSKGTTESYSYDWKNNLVNYRNISDSTNMYYAYDIGTVRLAKGYIVEEEAESTSAASSSTSNSKANRKDVETETTGSIVTTLSSTIYSGTFASLGLNWMEFYHKSDNIGTLFHNISLDDGISWIHTDTLPLTLEKQCPYVSQINLDPADYESLQYGVNFVVTESGGTQSHSFDLSGNFTTSFEADWWGAESSATSSSLHVQAGNTVESEGMQVTISGRWKSPQDAFWLNPKQIQMFLPFFDIKFFFDREKSYRINPSSLVDITREELEQLGDSWMGDYNYYFGPKGFARLFTKNEAGTKMTYETYIVLSFLVNLEGPMINGLSLEEILKYIGHFKPAAEIIKHMHGGRGEEIVISDLYKKLFAEKCERIADVYEARERDKVGELVKLTPDERKAYEIWKKLQEAKEELQKAKNSMKSLGFTFYEDVDEWDIVHGSIEDDYTKAYNEWAKTQTDPFMRKNVETRWMDYVNYMKLIHDIENSDAYDEVSSMLNDEELLEKFKILKAQEDRLAEIEKEGEKIRKSGS